MKEKISKLIKELNKDLVQREEIIKIALLTMLAQENMILIGPPGTAKSEISRRLSQVIDGEDYFEYLLTKFTTPEEIFGPLSISELKQDRLKRNTEGYMPVAKIAFLDEIFKANSSTFFHDVYSIALLVFVGPFVNFIMNLIINLSKKEYAL